LDYGLDIPDSVDKHDNVDKHDKSRNKPSFGPKHFFGAGWWEAILAKKATKHGVQGA
jgi:hypothetical protein